MEVTKLNTETHYDKESTQSKIALLCYSLALLSLASFFIWIVKAFQISDDELLTQVYFYYAIASIVSVAVYGALGAITENVTRLRLIAEGKTPVTVKYEDEDGEKADVGISAK